MDGRCKGQTGGQMNQKNQKQQHKHNQSTDQQS